MSSEIANPTTIRDLRVRIAIGAVRGAHVFDRTLLRSPSPMPPATLETNLMAHFATTYGFALVEVLREVEARYPEFAEELLHTVIDIGENGDDGRCEDIWSDVEARIAEGGVGTPAWDAKHQIGVPADSESHP